MLPLHYIIVQSTFKENLWEEQGKSEQRHQEEATEGIVSEKWNSFVSQIQWIFNSLGFCIFLILRFISSHFRKEKEQESESNTETVVEGTDGSMSPYSSRTCKMY